MTERELKQTIKDMVIVGKGILAADESVKTAAKRLASINAESTEETRRQYRNMILTAPGIEKYICGVILFEETLHQKTNDGVLFPGHLKNLGIVPGIKVDQGLADLNDSEQYTKGLEGLGGRLKKYKKAGARFAKWRAVYNIRGKGEAFSGTQKNQTDFSRVSKDTPSFESIKRNAKDLAEYAKICQEYGFVPIVEPEVLIDGTHTINKCYDVTEKVLKEVFDALKRECVVIEHTVLKPSMVISGKQAENRAGVDEVARKTVKCLKATIPKELPSINFLSGGQSPEEATAHLNRMHTLGEKLPWYLSFSYARALQEPALKAWQGKEENLDAAQKAFLKRAKFNGLATMGKYREEMEKEE